MSSLIFDFSGWNRSHEDLYCIIELILELIFVQLSKARWCASPYIGLVWLRWKYHLCQFLIVKVVSYLLFVRIEAATPGFIIFLIIHLANKHVM